MHTNVSELTALLANTGVGEKLDGVAEEDTGRPVEGWPSAEEDVEAVEVTVDMVLTEEQDE